MRVLRGRELLPVTPTESQAHDTMRRIALLPLVPCALYTDPSGASHKATSVCPTAEMDGAGL